MGEARYGRHTRADAPCGRVRDLLSSKPSSNLPYSSNRTTPPPFHRPAERTRKGVGVGLVEVWWGSNTNAFANVIYTDVVGVTTLINVGFEGVAETREGRSRKIAVKTSS